MRESKTPRADVAAFFEAAESTEVVLADFARTLESELTRLQAEVELPCGHHSSLLVKSVESNYQYCDFCECRKQRNDALTMEEHYKQRAETAESALLQAREDAQSLGMRLMRKAEECALYQVQLDELLAHCPNAECAVCASIICPHRDRLHFHHDGCPTCAQADAARQAEGGEGCT